MENTLGGRKWLVDIICVLCVVLATCACWVNAGVGSPGLLDESYQALCVRYYSESPMAMGVFWVGNIWSRIFGDSFLSLRLLNCLISFLAVAAATVYLWVVVRSWRVAAWTFVLAMVIGVVGRHTMYNWDGGAYLFFVLAEIAALQYIRRNGTTALFMMGVTAAMAAIARVPAMVCIPLGLLVAWRFPDDRWHRWARWKSIGVYLAGIILAFIIITTAMCGSAVSYLSAFISENVVSGHSPGDLAIWMTNIRNHLFNSLSVWMFGLVSILVAIWLSTKRRPTSAMYVGGCLIMIVMGAVEAMYVTPLSDMESGAGPLGAAFLVFMLVLMPLYNIRASRCIVMPKAVLLVLWAWFLIPAIGSDLWFRRFLVYYQLPLAVAVIFPMVRDVARLRRLLTYVALLGGLGGGVMLATRVVVARHYSSVQVSALPKCEGVCISPKEASRRADVYALYRAAVNVVGADRVNIDGYRYFYLYSLPTPRVDYLHRFHFHDTAEDVAARRDVVAEYDAWLFAGIYGSRYASLFAMLEQQGFEIVYDDSCGDKGNILFLRHEYAGRFRSFFGCADRNGLLSDAQVMNGKSRSDEL